MLVLGLESTCDETACAVVQEGKVILSNVVTSQIDLHSQYGGVVPELACRRHVDVIIPVIDEALKSAQITLQQVDLIAVAHGPGLIGALLIGLNAAKTLALALNKPFIGVNHIQAHLYAALMSCNETPSFPCLGVVLSGGHTSLIYMEDIGSYQTVATTADDALGEAFDKVATMLQLSYPGGPYIEKLALHGNPKRFPFKVSKVKGRPLDFSFSGLKTAVLYAIKDKILTSEDREDLAASFQQTAFIDVIQKTVIAAEQYNCKTLLLGGGVTNNQRLRQMFEELAPHLRKVWPSVGLSLDNAAMIAGLGYHLYMQRGNQGDSFYLEPFTRETKRPLKGRVWKESIS